MRDFVPRLAPVERQRRYRADGLWTDDTFASVAAEGLVASRNERARILSATRPYDGTVGDLADQGAQLAGLLASRGIGTGDVVAVQLPNWAEAVATFYGLLRLGAVAVPVVHIYGHKELGHILRESRARALITTDRFGSHDYVAELADIDGPLPDLELVVMVETQSAAPRVGPDTVTWDDVLAFDRPFTDLVTVDPDTPSFVCYTSGTTAAPKGVVHSSRSFIAEMRQGAMQRAQVPLPAGSVMPRGNLSGAPVGHVAGMMTMLGPVMAQSSLHMLDRWDAGLVLRIMREDLLTSGSGATFFLNSLIDHPDFDPSVHGPLMSRVGMGGSPIPAEIARRASALGISLVRSYGSTEHPSITGASHGEPEVVRTCTDGAPMPGVELRLVDDDGVEVGVGTPGEILSRGPELFLGYADPSSTAAAFDGDWYVTGDVGVLDEAGNLTITDRKKDIIIRGGENVSAAEVEELVLRIPSVTEVAVVAAPDARLGEHVCAFVRAAPGADPPSLDDVRAHLEAAGLARQKWPEELRHADDLPRTPSGKVKKFVLREQLRAEHSG